MQRELAGRRPDAWTPGPDPSVGACFGVFPKGQAGRGTPGDPVWSAAVTFQRKRRLSHTSGTAFAGGPYVPGLFALRVGPALDTVVRALHRRPDVLLVDATGRDHPRHCGLALHLGAMLSIPTIGITHRTLLATGDWPADERGATSPLLLDGENIGYWLRTRPGRRPIAVHAAWRTDADIAVRTVLLHAKHRTPGPLREARRLARQARAEAACPAS